MQIWKGSPNFWQGGLHDVCAIVLHTMVGSLGSCDAQFANPGSQVSAHFGVGLDGAVHQYVNLSDAAWANGILEGGNRWEGTFGSENPNRRSVSIETEDMGQPDTEPVTDQQFASVLSLCLQARIAWPDITHLVTHHAISPQSRSCPAARWLNSGRFEALASALGLAVLR